MHSSCHLPSFPRVPSGYQPRRQKMLLLHSGAEASELPEVALHSLALIANPAGCSSDGKRIYEKVPGQRRIFNERGEQARRALLRGKRQEISDEGLHPSKKKVIEAMKCRKPFGLATRPKQRQSKVSHKQLVSRHNFKRTRKGACSVRVSSLNRC